MTSAPTKRVVLCSLASISLLAALAIRVHSIQSLEPVQPTVYREFQIMGTLASVAVLAEDRSRAIEASQLVLEALVATENRLSTWREDSELSQLNRSSLSEGVRLSQETQEELAQAEWCRQMTDGAFDISVGRLVDLWDLRGQGAIPSNDQIVAALESQGTPTLRQEPPRVFRQHPHLRIEEGGFGKGAAIDRAISRLSGYEGIQGLRVDLGGQIGSSGRLLAKETLGHPKNRHTPLLEILSPLPAMATSGNSQRARVVSEQTIGHLLDPRTGRPAKDFGSLTVWTNRSLTADCLATGFFVMGPDLALHRAEQFEDVEVLVVRLSAPSSNPPDRLQIEFSSGLKGRIFPVSPRDRTTDQPTLSNELTKPSSQEHPFQEKPFQEEESNKPNQALVSGSLLPQQMHADADTSTQH